MKRLIAALIFTLLVSPAFAMTTLSSTLVFIANGTSPSCNFVNVSTKPMDVHLSLVDMNNTLLANPSFLAVPSQQGKGIVFPGGAGTDVRCTFTFSGSSKSLRAALELLDTNFVAVAALPAT